jgi:phage terminase large subunit
LYGIQTLAQYPIRAIGYNLNREFRQYKWKLHSATGKTIQEPSSSDDHALDAVRYWAVMNLAARPRHNSIVSI